MLGQTMKALRIARGMSQAGVADACGGLVGIDQSKISAWERGDRQPSAGQLAAWLDALGASDDERVNALALARSDSDAKVA